ncbi:patatin-like phospholipase family protein [Desulfosoma caldarium]|uniref:patatin-like phospholipase family protein n=1 Tax=Desulfosoma caldarium TaxID=610254 RepID=UPI001B86109B|nr:patatin-like phospholipase family protein [Desulfosoma caldarium]
MGYPFRNLVFEGGRMKGIAHVGALQVLEEKNILPQILRVGGTSAGAITAVMVGLNDMPSKIWEAVSYINFGKFMDDDFGVVRDIHRLIYEFGWYKGNAFRKWIGEIIAHKAGHSEATFLQVHRQKAAKGFRDLYFIGTNISTHFCEFFSYEHTPRMCVADAVRISMSIPLFYTSRLSP